MVRFSLCPKLVRPESTRAGGRETIPCGFLLGLAIFEPRFRHLLSRQRGGQVAAKRHEVHLEGRLVVLGGGRHSFDPIDGALSLVPGGTGDRSLDGAFADSVGEDRRSQGATRPPGCRVPPSEPVIQKNSALTGPQFPAASFARTKSMCRPASRSDVSSSHVTHSLEES